jgi:S-adenosylmethionine synthetase
VPLTAISEPERQPDGKSDGVVHWRCRDLQERIRHRFGVILHERTVGKLLVRQALVQADQA